MSDAWLIATLGTHDVQVYCDGGGWSRGDPIGRQTDGRPAFRVETERIWRRVASGCHGDPVLTYPLVLAALRAIRDHGDTLVKVILVATDQPDAGDTCFAAELLTFALTNPDGDRPTERSFEDAGVQRLPGRDAVVSRIVPGNPSDPQVCWPFAARELDRLVSEPHPERVYLSLTAGTPALSMAFVLHGLSRLGDRALLLQVSRDGTAHRSPLQAEILWRSHRERQWALLKSHAFAPARVAHEATNARDPGRWELARALLRHAEARVAGDYPAARLALVDGLEREADDQDLLRRLLTSLGTQDEPGIGARLWDVVDAARFAVDAGAWRDLVYRVYQIGETALFRLAVRCGCPDRPGKAVRAGELLTALSEDARARVEARWRKKHRYEPEDSGDPYLGADLLLGALEEIFGAGGFNDFRTAQAILWRLRPVTFLRNRVMHRHASASRDDVVAALNARLPKEAPDGAEPLQTCEALLDALATLTEIAVGARPAELGIAAVTEALLTLYAGNSSRF